MAPELRGHFFPPFLPGGQVKNVNSGQESIGKLIPGHSVKFYFFDKNVSENLPKMLPK